MVKLLGVRDNGVFIVNDDDEELETIMRFPGCLMMFFKESEKNEALEWAGVTRVSGFKKTDAEEIKTSTSSSNFIKSLEKFRNKGYAYAELTLTNNEKFFILLGNIVYLSTKINLVYSYHKDELVSDVGTEFLSGNYLEERIKEYYDFSKTKLTLDECTRNYIEKFVEVADSNIAYSIKKPEISVENDMIMISETFSKIEKDPKDNEKYEFTKDNNDVMIKESNIMMIKPFKFKHEILNEDIIEVLKEYYPEL